VRRTEKAVEGTKLINFEFITTKAQCSHSVLVFSLTRGTSVSDILILIPDVIPLTAVFSLLCEHA